MSVKLNPLDFEQIIKAVFDEESGSLRTTQTPSPVSESSTPSGTGPAGESSASSAQRVQAYIATDGSLGTSAIVQVQVSPVEVGDVWADLGSPVESSLVDGEVVFGDVETFVAKRIRYDVTQAPSGGTVDVTLVLA